VRPGMVSKGEGFIGGNSCFRELGLESVYKVMTPEAGNKKRYMLASNPVVVAACGH
jgi:hypothetical protein